MRRRNQRGVVIMWVALMMLVLLGFVGLSIDFGLMTFAANQLQVGADAAALAGTQQVREDVALARQAAVDVARANCAAHRAINLDLNDSNSTGGDIVVGRFDRATGTFNAQLTNVNAVQVTVRLGGTSPNPPLSLAFGQLFGVPTVNITRRATAMIGGGTGHGMIALSPDDPKAIYVYGSARVTVNGGSIQVNSSDADNAVDLQGSKFYVDAPMININGGIDAGGGDIVNIDENGLETPCQINTGVAPVPDPLRGIAPPTPGVDLGEAKISGNEVRTLSPGYYSGGFDFSGGTITLEPGIYILGGSGFDVRGGTNLRGQGVIFYIESGPVSINGTGSIILSPPVADPPSFSGVGAYEGLLFFQARNNTTQSTINGTSVLDLTGTLYFPNNPVTLSGTSDKVGTQFIAHTIEFAGDSDLTINYNGNQAAPGNRVFLVR